MLAPGPRGIASLALVATLVCAAIAPAARDPRPVVSLSARISPTGRLRSHTPLTLHFGVRFKSVPPGGDFVLQKEDFLVPRGGSPNGRLFPSCRAAKLRAAHGVLGTCPKGSKIGSGFASGTAVAVGITARARLTLFNGPGGRSVTLNVDVEHPALINATWSAPLIRLHGTWALKLSETVPASLRTILGGDIVITRIEATAGAVRTVNGVRRGYLEAISCPKSGKVPFHGDFIFNHGAKTSADTTIAC